MAKRLHFYAQEGSLRDLRMQCEVALAELGYRKMPSRLSTSTFCLKAMKGSSWQFGLQIALGLIPVIGPMLEVLLVTLGILSKAQVEIRGYNLMGRNQIAIGSTSVDELTGQEEVFMATQSPLEAIGDGFRRRKYTAEIAEYLLEKEVLLTSTRRRAAA